MAIQPTTGLETHPAGSTGLSGIINANWETLEAIFAPLGDTTATKLVSFDPVSKTFVGRDSFGQIDYEMTGTIDFDGPAVQYVEHTGSAVYTSSNLGAGKKVTVIYQATGAARGITWPAYSWIGAAPPVNITSGRAWIVDLVSVASSNSKVIAIYRGETTGAF